MRTLQPAGRHPAVLALCVFAVGFAIVWAGFSPLAQDPYDFCPDAPQSEGSTVRTEPALWPPGTTTCEYATADGSASRTYVPWEDWLALGLFAAGVGVGVWALSSMAPGRPLRFGLAVSLLLAACAALFGALMWAPVLVPLAAATAILLVLERRVARRPAPGA